MSNETTETKKERHGAWSLVIMAHADWHKADGNDIAHAYLRYEADVLLNPENAAHPNMARYEHKAHDIVAEATANLAGKPSARVVGCYWRRAWALHSLAQEDEAFADLRQAMMFADRYQPGDYETMSRLFVDFGSFYYDMKMYATAHSYFIAAYVINPSSRIAQIRINMVGFFLRGPDYRAMCNEIEHHKFNWREAYFTDYPLYSHGFVADVPGGRYEIRYRPDAELYPVLFWCGNFGEEFAISEFKQKWHATDAAAYNYGAVVDGLGLEWYLWDKNSCPMPTLSQGELQRAGLAPTLPNGVFLDDLIKASLQRLIDKAIEDHGDDIADDTPDADDKKTDPYCFAKDGVYYPSACAEGISNDDLAVVVGYKFDWKKFKPIETRLYSRCYFGEFCIADGEHDRKVLTFFDWNTRLEVTLGQFDPPDINQRTDLSATGHAKQYAARCYLVWMERAGLEWDNKADYLEGVQ